ncbi:hypothetical protein C7444_11770 [Sphaerotilus hippei]|uniref:Esterase n=1 Tax=Sphaerotilus hippei TaxID=744406 RepID=A0A318GWC9_9BURK|nr:YqiA/YcfP family alpha/beta fold hydrolase [Sphaerotilus hippei]PXW93864.1 hypothetical protein C7444_11770 [Sphaerotilus hippei]
MATTHLLYLHGFRSSPQSFKARCMAAHMAQAHPEVVWWCPQLPPSPAAAIDLLLAGVAGWPADGAAVMGSSLGGFYATVLAERLGWRAVLVNPAVNPARDLARHIGEQTSWHDPAERFHFDPAFIGELQRLAPGELARPGRYLTLVAQGDEVLDWREMSERYRHTDLRVLPGGDHALSDFETHLPEVMRVLGL